MANYCSKRIICKTNNSFRYGIRTDDSKAMRKNKTINLAEQIQTSTLRPPVKLSQKPSSFTLSRYKFKDGFSVLDGFFLDFLS